MDDYVVPPCTEDPELFFDRDLPIENPERLFEEGATWTEEDRLVFGRWKREKRERQVKAQLTCLTMCPLPQRAMCEQVGLDETEGVWAGLLPEDRAQLRAGEEVSRPQLRSRSGKTRRQMAQELLSGSSIVEIAEMHGTKRKSVLKQLNEEVAFLSAPSGNVRVA